MYKAKPIIIVHGGTTNHAQHLEEKRNGITKALTSGYQILKKAGNAVDAVVKAVMVLEDDPNFNAGYGSVPNILGEIEMDAAIMTNGLFGAVAAIRDVKNPILIAKKVMEETEHILLVGENATKFARLMGFGYFNPLTDEMKERFENSETSSHYSKIEYFRKIYGTGTVGAIAMDIDGNIAAGVSTGGLFLHLPGRVGDSPLVGGGIYVNENGAAVFTGFGEKIAINLLAKESVDCLKHIKPYDVVSKLFEKYDFPFGLIILNKYGEYASGHNMKYLFWGYKSKNEEFSNIE